MSEAARPLRVAVIGAGPAGIYTADILTKSEEVRTGAVEVAIDIFDRYPAPFGLIRYGVAPDHPRIKGIITALHKVLDRGDIRFFGNVEYGKDLTLADLREHYDAIIFSTGFQVNLGTISCLLGREDYIIWDALNHASIIEGIRLSPAKSLRYKHNDMAALERRLQQCDPERIKLIVVDGVFSMEGDLCKLPEIVQLAEKYGASVMVDEAHGFGVLGDHGRGVCNHFGLTDHVDLIMGTFSKSFASIGGFIAGSKTTINFIRHQARSYIFSASCTPAATAAAHKSLEIMLREPERVLALQEKTTYCLDRFRKLGFEIGNTATPIVPLFIRDNEKTFRVTAMLFEEGVFVNPVVAPAVAPEDTLIRFSLMATHTYEQLDRAIDALHRVFVEYEVPLHPEP